MRNQYGQYSCHRVPPGGPFHSCARWDRPNQPPVLGLCSALVSYFCILDLSLLRNCISRFAGSADFGTVGRYNSITVLSCYSVIA